MIQKLFLRLMQQRFKRANLMKWARLEDKKKHIIQAVRDSSPNLQNKLEDYFLAAFGFRVNLSKVFWKDAMTSFLAIASKSNPTIKIPIIEPAQKPKEKDDPWNYSDRNWYMYANIIAKSYGWNYDFIAEMDVNDALALIQEILVSDQLEKEFQWALSEVSYKYDKATKKSKLVPLHRPEWMLPKFVPAEEKQKIPKRLLPVGNTVDLVNEIEKAHLRGNLEDVSIAKAGNGKQGT